MRHFRSVALAVVLLMTMVGPVTSQDPAPAGAFKAVHLVSLTPQQVAALQAWMADMNAAIDKAGHKDIRYRLYKVIGKQAGKYEHLWESSWPSGGVYNKIHDSPSGRQSLRGIPGCKSS